MWPFTKRERVPRTPEQDLFRQLWLAGAVEALRITPADVLVIRVKFDLSDLERKLFVAGVSGMPELSGVPKTFFFGNGYEVRVEPRAIPAAGAAG